MIQNSLIHACFVGRLTEEQSSIRAATLARRIVVGTRGGEICEIEKDGRIRIAIQGPIIQKQTNCNFDDLI